MKILIIGHGGREHALAWKAAQSSLVKTIFVAPGNAGTALEPKLKNIPINITNVSALLNFAQNEKIDLTIVGPELPLSIGIVDTFRSIGLKIFGPTKAAAQLESSKIFAKNFLVRHNIPTAKYQSFTKIKPALEYIKKNTLPIVIKANGLASGKGVIIAMTINEAESAIKSVLIDKIFGDAGSQIIIEEFLMGEEISFTVIVDGTYALPIATSQDHKQVGDKDTGLNTGGMGAYSPVSIVTDEISHRIMKYIILPTIRGMAIEGNIYTGFLYVGLMIDNIGNPKVIEFNCRLGDPEAQSIIFRMKSDIIDLFIASFEKKLNEITFEWDNRASLCVVMATKNYPVNYSIGNEIYGLSLSTKKDMKIFHSGTKLSSDGRILTNGGRVLCITALGSSVKEAQKHVYEYMKNIYWNGSFSRQDIGYRDIDREKETE